MRNSPTINYLKHVLLDMLNRMGLEASLTIEKYGYYPKGMGEVTLEVQPCQKLRPIIVKEFGKLELRGVSVCTFLADRRAAERQAKTANELLKARGYEANIQVVNDMSNPLQKGSSRAHTGQPLLSLINNCSLSVANFYSGICNHSRKDNEIPNLRLPRFGQASLQKVLAGS